MVTMFHCTYNRIHNSNLLARFILFSLLIWPLVNPVSWTRARDLLPFTRSIHFQSISSPITRCLILFNCKVCPLRKKNIVTSASLFGTYHQASHWIHGICATPSNVREHILNTPFLLKLSAQTVVVMDNNSSHLFGRLTSNRELQISYLCVGVRESRYQYSQWNNCSKRSVGWLLVDGMLVTLHLKTCKDTMYSVNWEALRKQ